MSVLIIAEAGSNHMGSLAAACDLVDAAARAGADCVKFQMFRADRLYVEGPMREAARRWEMPLSWLSALHDYAEANGVEFMCSAFDKDSVDAVDPYVKRHKIASLESSDTELVAHAASKGRPLIISTGTSTPGQIQESVRAATGWDGSYPPSYRDAIERSDPPITLLHCVAAYPAPIEQANLRVMRIGGLSDHSTDPILLPVMAVALGATTIEKHLRLDGTPLDAPDYPHSITPAEFATMVRYIRMAESAMGDGVKRPMPSEAPLMALKRKPGKLRGE